MFLRIKLAGAVLFGIALIAIGFSQKSEPAGAAPGPSFLEPSKARPVRLARMSASQQDFSKDCGRVFNSSIVFKLAGFDKNALCVCMTETLESVGAQREDGKIYALASDAMDMIVRGALAGKRQSGHEIQKALLRSHPGMRSQTVWIQGALFHAFSKCAEKDPSTGPRIERIRALFAN